MRIAPSQKVERILAAGTLVTVLGGLATACSGASSNEHAASRSVPTPSSALTPKESCSPPPSPTEGTNTNRRATISEKLDNTELTMLSNAMDFLLSNRVKSASSVHIISKRVVPNASNPTSIDVRAGVGEAEVLTMHESLERHCDNSEITDLQAVLAFPNAAPKTDDNPHGNKEIAYIDIFSADIGGKERFDAYGAYTPANGS